MIWMILLDIFIEKVGSKLVKKRYTSSKLINKTSLLRYFMHITLYFSFYFNYSHVVILVSFAHDIIGIYDRYI